MKGYETVKVDTKVKIIRAFWDLYKTTRIEKITVKSITDACGIYRTTFYLHFADVYAVLEYIEGMLLREIRDITMETENPTRAEHDRFVTRLTMCFTENFDYLRTLLDGKHNPEFARTYKREMIHRIGMLHHMDIEAFDAERKEIAVKSMGVMIDLFLELGESPNITFEKLAYVIDGYMKNGIIRTLSTL